LCDEQVQPLHFAVKGSGGNIALRPYFENQKKGDLFTIYPCFSKRPRATVSILGLEHHAEVREAKRGK
jgi:hypothetical protein